MDGALRDAEGAADIVLARGLFEEYATWLGVDLCFQGFAGELASLPGDYAPPNGRLILAGSPGDAFGCVALRRLDGDVCEMKRMYVQPRARGGGWGRKLAGRIVADARAIGYREIRLDTLGHLHEAQALYKSMGFRMIDPYYNNPLAGVVYMALAL